MDETYSDDLARDASVERTTELAAPPEEVWHFVVDGDLLSTWMGSPVEIEAEVGGRIEMVPSDGPTFWGTVEDVHPGHRIQWSWRSDDSMPALVEIELDPTETGTRLTVRETLLPWRVSGPDHGHITLLAA